MDLAEELLLFEGYALLLKLERLEALLVITERILQVLFFQVEVRGLDVEGFVDLEKLSKVTVQALDLENGLTVSVIQIVIQTL